MKYVLIVIYLCIAVLNVFFMVFIYKINQANKKLSINNKNT